MRFIKSAAEIAYWLLVSVVPLLPAYAYGEYPSVQTCNMDGICFRTGGAILNGEAEVAIYAIALLVWPVCILNIFGKRINFLRSRFESFRSSRMRGLIVSSAIAYWVVVATIPVLFWYVFATFLAPHDCNLDRSCFQFYEPLTGESKVTVLIAFCVIWPLCAWKIFEWRRGEKS